MGTKKSHIHHKWHLKIEAGFFLLLFLAGSQHALFCILHSSAAVIVLSLTSSSGSLALFLQPPACRACKPRHGLFLPAGASLDVSNPNRFLTPWTSLQTCTWLGESLSPQLSAQADHYNQGSTTLKSWIHPRSWTDKTLMNCEGFIKTAEAI